MCPCILKHGIYYFSAKDIANRQLLQQAQALAVSTSESSDSIHSDGEQNETFREINKNPNLNHQILLSVSLLFLTGVSALLDCV